MVLNSVGSANLPGKCGKRKFCVSAVYSTGRCCTDGRYRLSESILLRSI